MSNAPKTRDAAPPDDPGALKSKSSSRAGLLPVALGCVPIEAVAGLSVYIRVSPKTGGLAEKAGKQEEGFRLYSAADMRFTDFHKNRLVDHGVKFVYLKVTDQPRFRKQVETHAKSKDPAQTDAMNASIVYETSLELMNELLGEPDFVLRSPRQEQLSRSITTLVMNKPAVFEHLLAASQHDFYTGTHMVNVATWMVPLAHELGHQEPEALTLFCQAGILHDVGKLKVSPDVLNKGGKLTEEEWRQVQSHPQAGHDHLAKTALDPLVARVALEHHERMDGSGYPRKLKGDDIHEASRMCAVIDSFAAMTAYRPFKPHPLGVHDALAALRKDEGKYDPKVLEAFARMIKTDDKPHLSFLPSDHDDSKEAKHDPRRAFRCAAQVKVIRTGTEGEKPGEGFSVMTQDISRSWLGFLSHRPFETGDVLRVYIQAKGWESRALEGRVVRCRSFDEHWHEISMQFSTLVEHADAAAPPPPPQANAAA
jgi:HD-GYP domain-containing protein (c-di-GMP phosphodiesterase class II)